MKFHVVLIIFCFGLLFNVENAKGQESASISGVDSSIFGSLTKCDTLTGNGEVTFFFFGNRLAMRSKSDSTDSIQVYDPVTCDPVFTVNTKNKALYYRQDLSLPYLILYESLEFEGDQRIEMFDSTGNLAFSVVGQQGGMSPSRTGKFFYTSQGDDILTPFPQVYNQAGQLYFSPAHSIAAATMIGDTVMLLIDGSGFYDRITVFKDTTLDREVIFDPPFGITSPYILASPTAKYSLISGREGPVIVMDSSFDEVYRSNKIGIFDSDFSNNDSYLAFLKRGEYRSRGEYDLFVELFSISDFINPIWTDQLDKSLSLYVDDRTGESQMAFRGEFLRLLVHYGYFMRFGTSVPDPKSIIYHVDSKSGQLLNSCIFNEVVDVLAFGDMTITASTAKGQPHAVIISYWQQ